jgi:2-hydroxy-6-oxonona-2,4-dienedioate hydrolase/2-hydroxy-6-oxo-6-(2'-carboxyphenyl)-hexa-2,4-dienoate hydrolase
VPITVNTLKLSKEVKARPLSEWPSIATELLGTQTKIIQGKQFRHRVIECGDSGEPLILIHGVGGHAETYARNLHNLKNNGFHVFAIDALYHGFSSHQPYVEDDRANKQAEALVDLIDALGFPYAHVEGESMGGAITMEFGMHFPERAGKLIMNTGVGGVNWLKTDFPENPGGGLTLAELSQASVLTPTFETVRKRMEWLVAEPSRMTDEMVDLRLRLYSFPDVYESMKRVYRVADDSPAEWSRNPMRRPIKYQEADLQNWKPDSLVFWTEKNPGQGPAFGEYAASKIRGAKFYNMLDAAHWPQWEKPEEHDQVLIDFILG